MREIQTTIRGNVTKDPQRCTGNDAAQVRVAVNSTYFDRDKGAWAERKTEFITVFVRGSLARNALDSLQKGQPVIASGRLGSSQWEREDGSVGHSLVLQAECIGHDLTFGSSTFRRPPRRDDDVPEMDPDTGEVLDSRDAGESTGPTTEVGSAGTTQSSTTWGTQEDSAEDAEKELAGAPF